VKIAIIAGETSGDVLAASLIHSLKVIHPECQFFGVGGPLMVSQGCQCLYSMDEISIIGIDQLLGRVHRILSIRRRLRARILELRPVVFVGVDAPDFNLGLEVDLRKAGIPCVHYVSPTVWAWRGYRIRKIARAVDRMLTLFPFEASYYQRHHIPVSYVGHPLADEISGMESVEHSRTALQLETGEKMVAVLPGSRHSEVEKLLPTFLAALTLLAKDLPRVRWYIPAVNSDMLSKIAGLHKQLAPELSLDLVLGQSRRILNAANVALLSSGTATLEAALLATPMVVAYRVSVLTAVLVRIFRSVDYFAMPNHLTKRPVVPEYLQSRVNPEALAGAVRELLTDEQSALRQRQAFASLPSLMKLETDSLAAEAVLEVVGMGQQ